jgi:DNA-binding GntR family transcriptional regulator
LSTAANQVFEIVVKDILAGILRPGDRISERDLVTRFKLSRTPVREAIKRLFERGFVEAGPKGVAVITVFNGEELRDLYSVRVQLESYAAPLTTSNISAAEIDELRRINKRFAAALGKRDLVQMLEVRAEFHVLTARATKNRWLAEILVMLRDRAYPVRHSHWQDAERAAQTIEFHDSMIEALRNRDAKRYRELVVQHIRAALQYYENRLRVPELAPRHRPRPARRTALTGS